VLWSVGGTVSVTVSSTNRLPRAAPSAHSGVARWLAAARVMRVGPTAQLGKLETETFEPGATCQPDQRGTDVTVPGSHENQRTRDADSAGWILSESNDAPLASRSSQMQTETQTEINCRRRCSLS
jgi:hypothetical protein